MKLLGWSIISFDIRMYSGGQKDETKYEFWTHGKSAINSKIIFGSILLTVIAYSEFPRKKSFPESSFSLHYIR